MRANGNTNIGTKRIIDRLRAEFEIEENINYYSVNDFLTAQRKYIKFMLDGDESSLRLYPGVRLSSGHH
jgi:hypothetical protein